MSLCHDHILVSGRVQGVGYRYFAFEAARRAGVFGNVRNLHDGRVEINACGNKKNMDDFIGELKRGPHFSTVDNVSFERTERETNPYTRFEILH